MHSGLYFAESNKNSLKQLLFSKSITGAEVCNYIISLLHFNDTRPLFLHPSNIPSLKHTLLAQALLSKVSNFIITF
jgi:hypothetical protein